MDYTTRVHPRARRITLRLDTAGRPVITVPPFTPKWFVSQFVKNHTDWIAGHQQQLQNSKGKFLSDVGVTIFGRQYTLAVTDTDGASAVTIDGSTVRVKRHTGKKTADILSRFLKNTATHYLIPRTRQLAEKMNTAVQKITLRAQTTRWGSCSSTGTLSFNWKLVHFPPDVIDYVIIHELAHRQHMDHSKEFWQCVERYNPEYRVHRGWLKRQGIGVL